MGGNLQTVQSYLDALPAAKRALLEPVLTLVRNALPDGYEEIMSFGMPTWQVPLTRYPDTYNKQPFLFAGLASRKDHLSLYLSGPFANAEIEQTLKTSFAKAGKKLNIGASCIRFKSPEDLDLASVKTAIAAMPIDELISRAKEAQLAKKR